MRTYLKAFGVALLLWAPLASCNANSKDPDWQCDVLLVSPNGAQVTLGLNASQQWDFTPFATIDDEGQVADEQVAESRCLMKVQASLASDLGVGTPGPVTNTVKCACTGNSPPSTRVVTAPDVSGR